MQQAIKELQTLIESALQTHLPQVRHPGAKTLDEAIQYVFPGGKRLRPVLTLMGARIFAEDIRPALPAACAVEFIHTASLIFDDLPCMDDAELRRGLPVIHKVYGEEVAQLVGIALLNQSYAIFGKVPALIAEACFCIGTEGMIGGQALDLVRTDATERALYERQDYLLERNRKTSAMMRLALTAGALSLGVPQPETEALGNAGQWLGEAYQIGDDILDIRRSSDATGKTSGQDKRHHRPSHTSQQEKAAVTQLVTLVADARATLQAAYGDRATYLLAAIDLIFNAQIAEATQAS
jgi:geranylgeranyl diphosphate synthase type II